MKNPPEDMQLTIHAAHACGLTFGVVRKTLFTPSYDHPDGKPWDPLNNNSDAFNLMVALKMTVTVLPAENNRGYEVIAICSKKATESLHKTNAGEATRRAIVRAAAGL